MGPLSISLGDEVTPALIHTREVVMEYLNTTGRGGTLERMLRCGTRPDHDPERRCWPSRCRYRWDPLCLHTKAQRAYRKTPEAAKRRKYWALATARMAEVRTMDLCLPQQMEAVAHATLGNDALRRAVDGSFWTCEVAFLDDRADWLLPHVHLLVAFDCDPGHARSAWEQSLDELGIEASRESFKPRMTEEERLGAIHYLFKHWPNRMNPREGMLRTMQVFESFNFGRRTGVFSNRGKSRD